MMDHSSKKKTTKRATFRFVKAYVTTFVVLSAYAWLSFKSKIFGQRYLEDHINAVHQKSAQRIEDTILSLQGLFIKVGQLFSIMTNILPEAFRTGLENLQDAVPARPFSEIEQRIFEEFKKSPSELFKTFEKTPLASASLGQVHRATTHEGDEVAVKVQHVGVESMARADLKTIWRILGIVKLFFKVSGIDNYYHEIKSMILEELDFKIEAKHISKIAENFRDSDKVVFPEVLQDYSTSRVLTLSYVEGVKITDIAQLEKRGVDPTVLAKNLLTVYCQMIFQDGVYHADPHPGNIMVQSDGKIVLLDFGAVGYLPEKMRQGISSFLEAIIQGNEEKLLNSLHEMGFLRTRSDKSEAAAKVIEHFHRKFQEEIKLDSFSLSSIKMDTSKGLEHLADLKEMNTGIRELSTAFSMPREWVLLERTALLLTGLCTHLDPQLNPTDIIRPYLQEFILGKDRDWSEMLFDVTREKLLSFLSLPSLFEKFVNRTVSGDISIQVEGLPEAAGLIYSAGHQIIFALFTMMSSGIAVFFHHSKERDYCQYACYCAGFFFTLMLISMFRARKFRRRS